MRGHWRQHGVLEQLLHALLAACLDVCHLRLDVRHLVDLETSVLLLHLFQCTRVRSRSVGLFRNVAIGRVPCLPRLCSEQAVDDGCVDCKNGHYLFKVVRYRRNAACQR